MSKRGDAEYLADIREAIQRIESYTTGLTYEQFLADGKTQNAVIRNVEILGEAAKRLSAGLIAARRMEPFHRTHHRDAEQPRDWTTRTY